VDWRIQPLEFQRRRASRFCPRRDCTAHLADNDGDIDACLGCNTLSGFPNAVYDAVLDTRQGPVFTNVALTSGADESNPNSPRNGDAVAAADHNADGTTVPAIPRAGTDEGTPLVRLCPFTSPGGTESAMTRRSLLSLFAVAWCASTAMAARPGTKLIVDERPSMIAVYKEAGDSTTFTVLADGTTNRVTVPGNALIEADGRQYVLTARLGEVRDQLSRNPGAAAWIAAQMGGFAATPTSDIPTDTLSPATYPRFEAKESCGNWVSATGECKGTCVDTGKCVGCLCLKSDCLRPIDGPEVAASRTGRGLTELLIEFTDDHESGEHRVAVYDPAGIAEHAAWAESMSKTHPGWRDVWGATPIAQASMGAPRLRTANGQSFLPLRTISALRDQAMRSSSTAARSFTAWATNKLGDHADASSNIPINALTVLETDLNTSASLPGTKGFGVPYPEFVVNDSWCGDFVKLDGSCAPGCPSGPKPTCTGCICAGSNKKLVVATDPGYASSTQANPE
jgi:hypothetical protein